MVIEVQKYDHFALNYVDNHPIADMRAHHAGQVMTECFTDEWVLAYFGELAIDAIPQNMILLGEPLKILLKFGSQESGVRYTPCLSELLQIGF